MERDTISRNDRKQVEFIKNRYNAFLDNKFTLLDEIEKFKRNNKQFTHLTLTCQKLTEEMIRMDATRMEILAPGTYKRMLGYE